MHFTSQSDVVQKGVASHALQGFKCTLHDSCTRIPALMLES